MVVKLFESIVKIKKRNLKKTSLFWFVYQKPKFECFKYADIFRPFVKNSWLKVYISLEKFNVFTFSYVDHKFISCWYNHKYILIIILLMLIHKSKEYITFWCFKTDVVTDSSNRDRGPNVISPLSAKKVALNFLNIYKYICLGWW